MVRFTSSLWDDNLLVSCSWSVYHILAVIRSLDILSGVQGRRCESLSGCEWSWNVVTYNLPLSVTHLISMDGNAATCLTLQLLCRTRTSNRMPASFISLRRDCMVRLLTLNRRAMLPQPINACSGGWLVTWGITWLSISSNCKRVYRALSSKIFNHFYREAGSWPKTGHNGRIETIFVKWHID